MTDVENDLNKSTANCEQNKILTDEDFYSQVDFKSNVDIHSPKNEAAVSILYYK